MNYLWTTIHVIDMDESVKFYEEVIGLSVNRRFFAGPDMEITFMGNGETQIELIYGSNMKVEVKERGISLGFQVESLENIKKIIEEKNIFSTQVYQPNPKTKYFFIDDPNGVSIQFVELA